MSGREEPVHRLRQQGINPYRPGVSSQCSTSVEYDGDSDKPTVFSFARFLSLIVGLLAVRWILFAGSIAIPDLPFLPPLSACDYMTETPELRAACHFAWYGRVFLNIILIALFAMLGAKFVLRDVTGKYMVAAGIVAALLSPSALALAFVLRGTLIDRLIALVAPGQSTVVDLFFLPIFLDGIIVFAASFGLQFVYRRLQQRFT